MPRGRRSTTMLMSLVAAAVALVVSAAPALGGDSGGPSVRLIRPSADVTTIRRSEGQPAYLDAGVLLAAVRGDLAIYAKRSEYGGPAHVWQDLGPTTRTLPSDVADGLDGLDRFFRIKLWDETGQLALQRWRDFCPSGEDVRINASGPMAATFPRMCWTNPFMLGTVWGIDRGWAVRALDWNAPAFDGPNGRYTMRMSIARRYRELLDVGYEAGSVAFDIRIKTGDDWCVDCPVRRELEDRPATDRSGDRDVRGTLGWAPSVADPDPSTIPDLRALPAFSISLEQHGQNEQLSFAATIWNAGPVSMIVEGFRRGDQPIMDAYQYFMRDGEAIGRARVGGLRYHGASHDHWHFLQFARYSLWSASMEEIYVSKKQAFCLVPTDAVDLTVEGADWRPYDDDLGTSCGSFDPGARWLRETLQAGWGDTYHQSRGTSLDISGVPNGIYYVAVEANPDGMLYESDRTNNVELRKIRLGGVPGARTLKVFDVNGIDA